MMLETHPLHPSLAREVVGLKLWERPDDATVAADRYMDDIHHIPLR